MPVILAGGSGTRLWPLSRSARPKQFLSLFGAQSLYAQTLERVSDPALYAPALVLTNADYRFIAAEQALEQNARISDTLVEPVARNTAAAVAAAAVYAARRYGRDAVLHVLPSDHAIEATASYWQAVATAAAAAREGWLVTFGLAPTSPETGYGYVEAGIPIGDGPVRRVSRFIEKPVRADAEKMLEHGGFSWNSGMFMLAVGSLLDECQKLAPETFAAASESVEKARQDLDFVRLDSEAFAKAPNISIDYAIFEKTEQAAVLLVDFLRADFGSWDRVWNAGIHDANGNLASGPVTFHETRGSLVVSEKVHVAVAGLEDLVVIAAEDVVYVGKLSEAQRVRGLVKVLRADPLTSSLV